MQTPRKSTLRRRFLLATALLAGCGSLPVHSPVPPEAPPRAPTSAEILAATTPADWRTPDPDNTLYVELPAGRVVIELAPAYAPHHVANIKALAREKYFDGLAVVRAQENYVVQWGDPEEDDKKRRPMKTGKAALPAEFSRAIGPELAFTRLADGDIYAPEAGHSAGFPAARDEKAGRTWLAHCYAMVGAARGDTADSGSGAELYVVIGQAPRHLDKNVTLVGRVVKGMELLTTLPRGTGALGFYENPNQRVPLRSIRVASDVPEKERTKLELLRTDTEAFGDFVQARRFRSEDWFVDKAGHIDLCTVPLPVR
jgi:peptidylprolyl isomerase